MKNLIALFIIILTCDSLFALTIKTGRLKNRAEIDSYLTQLVAHYQNTKAENIIDVARYLSWLEYPKGCVENPNLSDCDYFEQAIYNALISVTANAELNTNQRRRVDELIRCEIPTAQVANIQALLVNLEAPLKTINRCLELRPNESTDLNFVSDAGINTKYRMTRTSENEYIADININLQTNADEVTEDVIKQQFEHINSCATERLSALAGPNQETLKVRINNQTPSTIPTHTINLVPGDIRASYSSYELNMDCNTITHEIFHIMGLVDEYHETVLGITTKKGFGVKANHLPFYDCRAMGPTDSIMHDHNGAFNRMNRTPIYSGVRCSCRNPNLGWMGKRRCKAQLRELSANSTQCPDRTETINFSTENETRREVRTGLSSDQMDYIIISTPHTEKLLHAGQFRSIINGANCRERNPNYYDCSQNSYKTSREHGGTGCVTMPNICPTHEMWIEKLRIDQTDLSIDWLK